MRIRVKDHVKLQPDKRAKIALATTPRAQLDLYCVAPGQEQKPHTHGDQDKFYVVLEGRGRFRLGSADHALEAGDALGPPPWGGAGPPGSPPPPPRSRPGTRWSPPPVSSTGSSTTATRACSSSFW